MRLFRRHTPPDECERLGHEPFDLSTHYPPPMNDVLLVGKYGFGKTSDGPPCPDCGQPMTRNWTKLNFSWSNGWIPTSAHCPACWEREHPWEEDDPS